jgi:TPR repeat protein
MRNLIKTFLVMLMLMLSFSHAAIAGDLEDAIAAAKKGDFATALRLWTPLAEQGDIEAQFNLGMLYADGKGVAQNYKTAVKLFMLSAEQGDADAQSNLGVMYNNGSGVEQDYKTAVKWYMIAAEQGYSKAQYNLGVAYYNGTGVAQDYVKAHMWFNIAAINGKADAIKNRDIVAMQMTPAQIEKAQEAANRCIKQNFKNCD